MNWLIAVAREAPETPQPRTGMKMMSRMMLSRAPVMMPIMPKRALPCRRSWLLRVNDVIVKGVAKTMYRR